MYINRASHYLPKIIINNKYYTDLVGIDDEWIFKRSGIRERTRTDMGENTNTMAVAAVRPAIDGLPYPISDIDLIVGATYTAFDTVGTLAHVVQRHFNISNAKVVSISSACSSFLNAVEIVEGYFSSGKAKRALVVVSEQNSLFSDDKDKQAGHLWGDGAGAVFISTEQVTPQDMEVIDINTSGLGHIGKGPEAVWLRPVDGGLQMPYGKDIFSYATKYMVKEIQEILEKNRYTLGDVHYFIPHQANARIVNSVAESLGLPAEKLITNMESFGNTGSASTVIALSQNWHIFLKDQLVAFTVFGGGYSSGAMLLKKM